MEETRSEDICFQCNRKQNRVQLVPVLLQLGKKINLPDLSNLCGAGKR